MLKNVEAKYLILELLRNGEAQIIDKLREFEPIPIDKIIWELNRQFDNTNNSTAKEWIDWFLGENSPATKGDKEQLSIIKEDDIKYNSIIDRINKLNDFQ